MTDPFVNACLAVAWTFGGLTLLALNLRWFKW